jgi:hypothetical protein
MFFQTYGLFGLSILTQPAGVFMNSQNLTGGADDGNFSSNSTEPSGVPIVTEQTGKLFP